MFILLLIVRKKGLSSFFISFGRMSLNCLYMPTGSRSGFFSLGSWFYFSDVKCICATTCFSSSFLVINNVFCHVVMVIFMFYIPPRQIMDFFSGTHSKMIGTNHEQRIWYWRRAVRAKNFCCIKLIKLFVSNFVCCKGFVSFSNIFQLLLFHFENFSCFLKLKVITIDTGYSFCFR